MCAGSDVHVSLATECRTIKRTSILHIDRAVSTEPQVAIRDADDCTVFDSLREPTGTCISEKRSDSINSMALWKRGMCHFRKMQGLVTNGKTFGLRCLPLASIPATYTSLLHVLLELIVLVYHDSSMMLTAGSISHLTMASGTVYSRPFKLGLTLWSSCPRGSSLRSTSTANSRFSKSPLSGGQQHFSSRSLIHPPGIHCTVMQSMATDPPPPLRQILPRVIRRSLSSSSSESTASEEDNAHAKRVLKRIFGSLLSLSLALFMYLEGKKRGAQSLKDRLPAAEMLAQREALQKEEKKLKKPPTVYVHRQCGECKIKYSVECKTVWKEEKELNEKKDVAAKQELIYHRQCIRELERDLETRKASAESDKARKIPLEAVPGPDLSYCVYVERKPFPCPNCHAEKAEGLAANDAPKSVPHQNHLIFKCQPKTEYTGLQLSKPALVQASNNLALESLSADKDTTQEEMKQIKRAKETLKHREKELEVKDKERKKRIQQLNAPKSDQGWSIVKGILVGSALAFGAATWVFK